MEELMIDKIIAFVAQPEVWATVAFLALALWKVVTWKSKIENGIDNLAKTTDQRFAALDKATDQRFAAVDQRFDALDKATDQRFVVVMSLILAGKEGTRGPQSIEVHFRTNSPSVLSEEGVKLAKRMDAYAIADMYTEQLIKQAKEEEEEDEEKEISHYRIGEICNMFAFFKVPEDLKKKDRARYRKLEELAYNENFHMVKLMRVVSLILRDRVLEALEKEVPSLPPDKQGEKS